MPAVTAKIQLVTLCVYCPTAVPITMPAYAIRAERTLYTIACFTDIPAFNKTAKSPGGKHKCALLMYNKQYSSVGIVSIAHAKPDNNCSEIGLPFPIRPSI